MVCVPPSWRVWELLITIVPSGKREIVIPDTMAGGGVENEVGAGDKDMVVPSMTIEGPFAVSVCVSWPEAGSPTITSPGREGSV